MDIDLVWVGIGLTALGYFIGDGLKNFKNPSSKEDNTLIKETDLHYFLNISKDEMKDLLEKYPDAPKIELKGTIYYPYQQFMDWIASEDRYKK